MSNTVSETERAVSGIDSKVARAKEIIRTLNIYAEDGIELSLSEYAGLLQEGESLSADLRTAKTSRGVGFVANALDKVLNRSDDGAALSVSVSGSFSRHGVDAEAGILSLSANRTGLFGGNSGYYDDTAEVLQDLGVNNDSSFELDF